MKSSKRSNASSRKTPDRPSSEIWLVGGDDYTRERVRLALGSGARWPIRSLDSEAALASAAVHESAALIIRPAVPGVPTITHRPGLAPEPPVLLYGSPAALETLDDAACDDVLVEPWTAQELRYRVRRLLQRASVGCGEGRLYWGRYWIAVDDDAPERRVGISPVQLAMLEMLARAGDDPVPREALQAVVADHGPGSRAVDMHLSRLRGRLVQAADGWSTPPAISSVRGRGYRLECR